jgi:oxygen-independent coproporphyrinogen-3 oxidase
VKKSSDILRKNSQIYSARGGDVGKCVDYSQIKSQMAGYIPYYMYRQKNTVGNYENVGFALPGHEGLYNIYMMEEIHSIFASGAGAVSKLVDNTRLYGESSKNIERMFHLKYPYEYLKEDKQQSFEDTAINFYKEHGMI